jgi:SAM-dependent methyltransferase
MIKEIATPLAFNADYAEYYDLLYSDKDYEAECNFLDQLWRQFCQEMPIKVLDVGCGTGNHAILLAKRGYKVTGVDASAPMIAIARRKAEAAGLEITFHVARMEQMELGERWDTAICMFNTINYVTDDDLLRKALLNIHRHLKIGGTFLFDFRNGVPSLRSYSPVRVKWVRKGSLRILRISETQLDAMEHLFYTTYTCLVLDGDRLVKEFQDQHVVRFLFLREVQRLLKECGFEVIHACPFLEPNARPREEDWNIMVVAQAKGL